MTGAAISSMSSGLTKSLPLIAAFAFDALKIARDARGEAPKNNEELFLVSLVIFAMNSTSWIDKYPLNNLPVFCNLIPR